MSLEMEYDTIFQVIDAWEQLRRMDNHDQVAGCILFRHLFTKVPEAKELFGFPATMDPSSDEMQKSPRFLNHAAYMIKMFDRAFNMLGPDSELLADILSDLGKKHARMGIKEEWFPFMGESLIEALREVLSTSFTPDIEAAFKQVYNGLSGGIVESMNTEKAVLDSWAKLKTIKNYEEKAGVTLFQSFFRECPEAKQLFGFPADLDVDSEALLSSRRFTMHAKYFIEMLDKALSMVETKSVEENMKQLGALHNDYGVKPEFFPIMGDALFHTLKTHLRGSWNDGLQDAWADQYGRLSSQMTSAMKMDAKKCSKRNNCRVDCFDM